MLGLKFLSSLLLSVALVTARRSVRHAGLKDAPVLPRDANGEFESKEAFERRQNSGSQFLNSKTKKYAVDGSAIPEVNFNVGESYAGLLPISSKPNDPNELYFWFFPSTNPAAKKEILIWLNGGPGCSSLEGLLQENGPFLWQYGTYEPVPNPWAWNLLTNVVWVEQPIGTGFSQGKVTATDEEDVAAQFLGFWENFMELFSMQGYAVYIAGESYAGMYCPYIASAMLDKKNATYYNMTGMLIYDPSITWPDLQEPLTTVPFVDYWYGLMPFNNSFSEDLHQRHASCGYEAYMDKYLVYPPAGPQPVLLPSQNKNGVTKESCENIYWDAWDAATEINPCWDVYQVATTCPILWDVLGFPGSIPYMAPGFTTLYFNRTDVQKAINAPVGTNWAECTDGNVFVNGTDLSLPSALTVLPSVIDRTHNVIIGHGALDMILIANGTLLAIQNMTWGGKLGFQSPPVEPFYVPYHVDPSESTWAGAGVFGTAHSERGLTYVGVDLSGHMVPQYAPSAAWRHLELLLGRISSVETKGTLTTQPDVPQPGGPLGYGTAPQGYSDASSGPSWMMPRAAPRRRFGDR